ncbi:hypothetical protein COO60DRAFT_1703731 [Scenedesmus sp. NREL 46B-D3]|nr:hypothetical protein COO60DRAFT_1703731 [Scenedesmus sp. NREL 46B-D3]
MMAAPAPCLLSPSPQGQRCSSMATLAWVMVSLLVMWWAAEFTSAALPATCSLTTSTFTQIQPRTCCMTAPPTPLVAPTRPSLGWQRAQGSHPRHARAQGEGAARGRLGCVHVRGAAVPPLLCMQCCSLSYVSESNETAPGLLVHARARTSRNVGPRGYRPKCP